jgi:hypothetical protein
MKVLYPEVVGFREQQSSLFSAKAVRTVKESLLDRFCGDGFYLIDAVEEPMPNGADAAVKTRLMREALPALRRKVKRLSPFRDVLIILIGKVTYTVCLQALREDGFLVLNEGPIAHPAQGNQTRFRPALRKIMQGRLC